MIQTLSDPFRFLLYCMSKHNFLYIENTIEGNVCQKNYGKVLYFGYLKLIANFPYKEYNIIINTCKTTAICLQGGFFMAEQVLIQFRADKALKQEVTEIYERLGMDLPTAFRMFMARSKMVKGLPFEAKVPT